MKAFIGVSALFLVALAVYTATILLAESLYTHRGSYAYWICIPSTIRNVPEVGNASDLVFFSSAGDGPKSPQSAVSYITDAPSGQIIDELNKYFEQQGLPVHMLDSSKGSRLSSNSDPIEMSIDPTGGGYFKVTVTETF